jgi:DNA-binding transcriptional ArsR family regulator
VPLYQAKAEFFKTLGHPARIRILELLSERDHSVRELLDSIDIEPSNLSQQLSILRHTSLVASHRRDGEVWYSASAPDVRELLLVARTILSGLTRVDDEVGDLSPAPRSTTQSIPGQRMRKQPQRG